MSFQNNEKTEQNEENKKAFITVSIFSASIIASTIVLKYYVKKNKKLSQKMTKFYHGFIFHQKK